MQTTSKYAEHNGNTFVIVFQVFMESSGFLSTTITFDRRDYVLYLGSAVGLAHLAKLRLYNKMLRQLGL